MAWPNPSFNLSANSRVLGPHSAVVYRRTVRPKHPAVVARLTQTLAVIQNEVHHRSSLGRPRLHFVSSHEGTDSGASNS